MDLRDNLNHSVICKCEYLHLKKQGKSKIKIKKTVVVLHLKSYRLHKEPKYIFFMKLSTNSQ